MVVLPGRRNRTRRAVYHIDRAKVWGREDKTDVLRADPAGGAKTKHGYEYGHGHGVALPEMAS